MMRFWSWLIKRKDHSTAPLAVLEEKTEAVREDMAKSRVGLQKEARARTHVEAVRQQLIDEFEIAATAAAAAARRRPRG